MDLFDIKNISPMLMHEAKPFDDKDYIYELKLDGVRCIAYLDKDKTILRNKRNKDVTNTYPELKNINKQANTRCILDGELICVHDGKPDFAGIQKRALLTNDFKIKLAAKENKISFVAYDILYVKNKQITDLPLLKRKEILRETVKENQDLSISRFIENDGKKFFELTKKEGLEGIVAKKKNGIYFIGKRTREWVKIKALIDEDIIIAGIELSLEGGIKAVITAVYEGDVLKYHGTVSLGIPKNEQKIILDFAKKNAVKTAYFDKKNLEIVWLKPTLIATVKYMNLTALGHMRQPVFKGLRFDKP